MTALFVICGILGYILAGFIVNVISFRMFRKELGMEDPEWVVLVHLLWPVILVAGILACPVILTRKGWSRLGRGYMRLLARKSLKPKPGIRRHY